MHYDDEKKNRIITEECVLILYTAGGYRNIRVLMGPYGWKSTMHRPKAK